MNNKEIKEKVLKERIEELKAEISLMKKQGLFGVVEQSEKELKEIEKLKGDGKDE